MQMSNFSSFPSIFFLPIRANVYVNFIFLWKQKEWNNIWLMTVVFQTRAQHLSLITIHQ